MVFVGQLIPRKGLDLLLDAFAPLFVQKQGVRLTVVGDGPLSLELKARAAGLGLGEAVSFEGTIPAGEVRARVASHDVLVLPSRWDGWGMVVNEAFSVGVPVIVSDRCGASDLIVNGVNGFTFESGSVGALSDRLCQFAGLPPDSRMVEEALATGLLITAHKAASYLINCVEHMIGVVESKPVPPWLLEE